LLLAWVVRDAQGEIYTVRYEAVNAMLLNEFLKEHRKVEEQGCKLKEQEATIIQLKSTVAQQQKDFQETAAHQQKQIETLTAGLQKVSDRLELSKFATGPHSGRIRPQAKRIHRGGPAPQMVADNQ
jgi:uncharacterized coiled-coil protein SlyX